ncbi:MAG TPA: hypothetical protein VN920_15170 [Pyrinomonadaceae bacterium]|nr:hypothetical protein [Pyrinomonadaceae bacterium]
MSVRTKGNTIHRSMVARDMALMTRDTVLTARDIVLMVMTNSPMMRWTSGPATIPTKNAARNTMIRRIARKATGNTSRANSSGR